MTYRPISSLAFLGAVLGILGTAQAGTITWVTPISGIRDDHLTVSIKVDPWGLSAMPVNLMAAVNPSWEISIFDGTDTHSFSLTSAANTLILTTTTSEAEAPPITMTSIFLPEQKLGNDLDLLNAAQLTLPSVVWDQALGRSGFNGEIPVNFLGSGASVTSSSSK